MKGCSPVCITSRSGNWSCMLCHMVQHIAHTLFNFTEAAASTKLKHWFCLGHRVFQFISQQLPSYVTCSFLCVVEFPIGASVKSPMLWNSRLVFQSRHSCCGMPDWWFSQVTHVVRFPTTGFIKLSVLHDSRLCFSQVIRVAGFPTIASVKTSILWTSRFAVQSSHPCCETPHWWFNQFFRVVGFMTGGSKIISDLSAALPIYQVSETESNVLLRLQSWASRSWVVQSCKVTCYLVRGPRGIYSSHAILLLLHWLQIIGLVLRHIPFTCILFAVPTSFTKRTVLMTGGFIVGVECGIFGSLEWSGATHAAHVIGGAAA